MREYNPEALEAHARHTVRDSMREVERYRLTRLATQGRPTIVRRVMQSLVMIGKQLGFIRSVWAGGGKPEKHAAAADGTKR
jgi:hypothetical protein